MVAPTPLPVVKTNFTNTLPSGYPAADPANPASAVKYGDATTYTNINGSKMVMYATRADPVASELTAPVTYYKQIINTNPAGDIQSVVLKVVTLNQLPAVTGVYGVELYQYYTYDPAAGDGTYTLAAEYALKLERTGASAAEISSAVWGAAELTLAKPSFAEGVIVLAAAQPSIDATNGLLGIVPPVAWKAVGQAKLGSVNPFSQNILVAEDGMLFNFDDLAGSPSAALLVAVAGNQGTLEPTVYYSFAVGVGGAWSITELGTAPTLNDTPTPYVVKQNGVYVISISNVSYQAKVYITESANFSANDDGDVQLSGPIIIQLTTAIIPYDEPSDDTDCTNIIAKISAITAEAVNFGTLTDYQGIISAVNNYVANVDAQNVTLNAENVNALEAYATNISGISNLFGQLVVKLQSSHNVDSTLLINKISEALETIATGIHNMRAFKLAISQQNQFKISTCIINMAGYLSTLTQKYTLLDDAIAAGGNTYEVIDDNAPISKLFKLNESVNYFAAGMPAVAFSTGSVENNNLVEYVQTYTGNDGNGEYHYIKKSWYSSNFSMSADDTEELQKATALVNANNASLATQITQVYTDSNVTALNANLAAFTNYSSALSTAQNRLLYQLGVMGFNLKFN